MDWTYLVFVLPALLFSLWAQARVKNTFARYSQLPARMTGAEAAELVLRMNQVNGVGVEPIAGQLTDNYDPRDGRIRLSRGVYDAATVSAVGVAAHEAGHAAQYAAGYGPVKLRMAVIPACQFGSTLSWPLLILGMVLGSQRLCWAGILLFGLVVLFQLITLPVEFNASDRALAALSDSGRFDEATLEGAGKVLRAAALTYVAALAVSMGQLLRLLLIFGGGSDRRRR